jgi:TldD protein
VRSVDRGIYAVNFGGGQVDITSGKFVFSASEAYPDRGRRDRRAAQGRDADRQRDPTCSRACRGSADDLALDRGVGTCGKDGQSVPVGVGMPTIRIDDLTVGGTQG